MKWLVFKKSHEGKKDWTALLLPPSHTHTHTQFAYVSVSIKCTDVLECSHLPGEQSSVVLKYFKPGTSRVWHCGGTRGGDKAQTEKQYYLGNCSLMHVTGSVSLSAKISSLLLSEYLVSWYQRHTSPFPSLQPDLLFHPSVRGGRFSDDFMGRLWQGMSCLLALKLSASMPASPPISRAYPSFRS